MSKYYKHPKFKHVYGEELNTPAGRIAFVHLVTPQDPPPPEPGQAPGQPRFEATLVLDKNSQYVGPFLEEIATMAGEMLDCYNEGNPAKLSIESVVKDGDSYDMEKYPYYKNSWILVARNVKQPESLDSQAENIAHSSFIGGQQCRFRVQPLITSKGLSYKLKVVQLLRDDGTRFAGGVKDYKNLMAICSPEDSCEPAEVEAEAPVVEAPKVQAAPKAVAAKVAVKPAVAPKVDAASIRARAAARAVAPAPEAAKPIPAKAPAAKKGIGLALEKI